MINPDSPQPTTRVVENSEIDPKILALVDKWKETGLLDDIGPKWNRLQISILLENQRLFHEGTICTGEQDALFRRVAMRLIPKVYHPDGMMFKYISFQTSPGHLRFLRFQYEGQKSDGLPGINLKLMEEYSDPRTRRLEIVLPEGKTENEILEEMSLGIRSEINREIQTDLLNNAGTVAKTDWPQGDVKEVFEKIYIKMLEISGIIHRKTLRGGSNWIVTSPELVQYIHEYNCSGKKEEIAPLTYYGAMNSRWKLSSCPSMPKNQMLIGYSGDSTYDNGYIYAPYIPFSLTPMEDGRLGVITRYAKKLLREGAKHYCRLTFDNFPG